MKTIALLALSLAVLTGSLAGKPSSAAPVEIQLTLKSDDPLLPAEFRGLSYEMQRLLPDAEGRHYFRADNAPLLALFRTLGISCLRIGGNTADRPTVPFPAPADIDACFDFARAAGLKVIFTLRLREGDPHKAAAVAKHIVDRHSDVLWCFAIGNEPSVFSPEYPKFLAAWKAFAAVVTSAEFAPAARFGGPSATAGTNFWTRDFVRDLAGTDRLVLATQHIYPGGNADLVNDPAEGRRLMLSREWVEGYQKFHDGFVPGVLATGIPYRLGETNSFWNGGRRDASNTLAAALWALDYQHWWAAHGANGLNFHTGDFVAKAEENTRCMYAAFWSTPNGYEAKPVAYGLAAFSLSARGRLGAAKLAVNSQDLNITAYATHTPEEIRLTLINKEYGPGARDAEIVLNAKPGTTLEIIRLSAPDGDVARTDGLTLGEGRIREDGSWDGHWIAHAAADASGRLVVHVPAASAMIVKLTKDGAGAPAPKSEVRVGAPIEKAPLPKLPPLKPLFDTPIRDTSICLGHDGAYYLTGTTGWPDMWAVTGDIQVWRSRDLKTWTPVVEKPRARSIVWNADREGTWEKRIPQRDGAPFRPLWAPEISFIKGTYWICYSFPLGVGGGVIKSITGKPEGPYEAVFKSAPAVNAIDLALFADDDGKVYLIWGAGNIRELNAEMNGFVGEGWKLKPANASRIGFEGTFVFKHAGRYYITGAEFVGNPDGGKGSDYHCYAASGENLRGPFGDKFLAIPHAGHNSFFPDREGRWWATFFGNDPRAPFRERPAILAIEFTPDGRFQIAPDQPDFVLSESKN